MLRGPSVKSTCSRMVWAVRLDVASRMKQNSKLERSHQRRPARRTRILLCKAAPKGYRKRVNERKSEESGANELRRNEQTGRSLRPCESLTALPINGGQSRDDQHPRAGFRDFAFPAPIAARIALPFFAGTDRSAPGAILFLPNPANARQRRRSDRNPGSASERVVDRSEEHTSELQSL